MWRGYYYQHILSILEIITFFQKHTKLFNWKFKNVQIVHRFNDNLVHFSWHTEPTRTILTENRSKQNQGLLSDLKQAQDWHETDRKLSKTTLYFCIATEKKNKYLYMCILNVQEGSPVLCMNISITSLKTLLASQRFDQYLCIYTCIFSHFCFKNFQLHPKHPLSR